MPKIIRWLLPFGAVLSLLWGQEALATTAVAPQADALLKRMSDYLASLQRFHVEARISDESLLSSGLKVMGHLDAEVSVQRPDGLYARRRGEGGEQAFYFHAGRLSMVDVAAGVYSEVQAPRALDAMLDFAADRLGVPAPGRDLLYSDVYRGLMADVEAGYYLGKTRIGGVVCHHLAFRSTDVDWQIWIREGERPLPVKYVITSKWITGAPEYSVEFVQWDDRAALSPGIFDFAPQKALKKVESGHFGND